MITQKEEIKKTDTSIVLRVAAGSEAARVAGAIAKNLEEGKEVSLVAIGSGAVNQTVKALCIARQMVASKGWDLYFIPGFQDEMISGAHKTSIRFFVRK